MYRQSVAIFVESAALLTYVASDHIWLSLAHYQRADPGIC